MSDKLTLGKSNNDSMFDTTLPDQEKIVQIMEMGFERDLAASALVATNNSGIQEAVNWILAGGTVNPKVAQQQESSSNNNNNTKTVNDMQNNETQKSSSSPSSSSSAFSSNLEKDPTLNPDVDVLRETNKYSNSLRGFSRAERLEFEKRQREKYAQEKRRERQQKQAQVKEIRKQLQAERQARKQKKSGASSSNSPLTFSKQSTNSKASASSKPSRGECLLQLRLPDGRAKKKKFSSSDTIRTVYQFLESECEQTPGKFILIINIPRQEFGSSRFDETLEEAGLCPRAQMFVEQTENIGVVTRGEGEFEPSHPPGYGGPGMGGVGGGGGVGGMFPGGGGGGPGMMGGNNTMAPRRPPAYKGDDSDIDSSDDENDEPSVPGRRNNNRDNGSDSGDDEDDEDYDMGGGGFRGGPGTGGGGHYFPGAGRTLGN
eukprot:gb/GECH01012677.1/.p1 GENE.gb/GECH01012677.1/~~gb/GECH01012677.1/.p1  ORF type:complete len:430 (+),score=162.51 gb/GECH01012677.1/:1-1290(+)